MRLPAYSPDINIIENLWGMAKYSMLYDKSSVNSVSELQSLVESTWAGLSSKSSIVTNLIDSIEDRLDAIKRSDGFITKY